MCIVARGGVDYSPNVFQGMTRFSMCIVLSLFSCIKLFTFLLLCDAASFLHKVIKSLIALKRSVTRLCSESANLHRGQNLTWDSFSREKHFVSRFEFETCFKVVEDGTIEQNTYEFLLAFFSNFGHFKYRNGLNVKDTSYTIHKVD